MDAVIEIIVNLLSSSPMMLFMLYVWYVDRQRYERRLGEKNELLDDYRKRDWQTIDRAISGQR